MMLYIANLFQISTGELSTVGVFSSTAKAKGAGELTIIDFLGDKPIVLLDWDYGDDGTSYYYDGFTLHIMPAVLDKPI